MVGRYFFGIHGLIYIPISTPNYISLAVNNSYILFTLSDGGTEKESTGQQRIHSHYHPYTFMKYSLQWPVWNFLEL